MTDMISKEQAEMALALAFQFEGQIEHQPEMAKFNENATHTGTRYAMIEMAGVAVEIFEKLPVDTRDSLAAGDVFHSFVLGKFDYSQFPVPTLIGTTDEVAAWLTEEFELDQPTAPGL